MNTGRRRSALSYIPGYTNNAVLQLIIFQGVAFAILGLAWGIVLIIFSGNPSFFDQYFIHNISLPSLALLKTHPWAVLTYGWFNFSGFLEFLSSMLWLYCFGSVVQMLIGHKQVIPLFAYCLIAGGVFYYVGQLLPGELGKIPPGRGLLGPRAGLMGLAAAAVTISPGYKFYITETLKIPLLLVAGIFAALMLVGSGFYLPVVVMLIAGGVMGYGYVKLLQAGYRPGDWMYALKEWMEGLVTPANERKKERYAGRGYGNTYEPQQGVSQKRIDDILDKINQKGYNSLTREEKEILMRVGKD